MSVSPGSATQPPDLSVIIVSWNSRQLLEGCLQSLFDHIDGVTAEVIVVDNASTDGSQDMVHAAFPSVRLVLNASNLGFAAGANRGLALARGELVLLLNSDTVVRHDVIPRSVEKIRSDPSIGVLGVRLLNQDGTIQPSAHPHPFPGRALTSALIGKLRRRDPRDMEDVPRPVVDSSARPADVDYVKGAFLLIRHEALRAVGPFDERFFMYCEEADLCFRVQEAGWRVVIWPGVAVTHLGGGSTDGNRLTPAAVRQRLMSRLLFVAKHRPALVFAAYLATTLLSTFRYGIPWRSGSSGCSVVRARLAAIREAVTSYGKWRSQA